jgi:hypothetical protein
MRAFASSTSSNLDDARRRKIQWRMAVITAAFCNNESEFVCLANQDYRLVNDGDNGTKVRKTIRNAHTTCETILDRIEAYKFGVLFVDVGHIIAAIEMDPFRLVQRPRVLWMPGVMAVPS